MRRNTTTIVVNVVIGGLTLMRGGSSMRLLILIVMLAFVAGCQTDPVLLRHPQTGKTVQCGVLGIVSAPD